MLAYDLTKTTDGGVLSVSVSTSSHGDCYSAHLFVHFSATFKEIQDHGSGYKLDLVSPDSIFRREESKFGTRLEAYITRSVA